MKQRLMLMLRVVVSVGILAYLFHSIFSDEAAKYFDAHGIDSTQLSWFERAQITWTQGPQSLWDVFKQLSAAWFLLAVACTGLVCLFGIIRWQMILRVQGLNIPFSRVGSIWFIGMFFNAFMLGATGGDVIKAWYAARETHHKKTEAVITVLVDRLIGLVALLALALAVMAIYHDRVLADPKLRAFAWFAGGCLLAMVIAGVLGASRSLANQLSGLEHLFQRLPKHETIQRLIEAFRIYVHHPAVLFKTTLLSVGVHCAVIFSVVCVGYGMAVATRHGILDYLLYLPIINCIAAIPISIAGLGVREGLYATMFGEVGVSTSMAVAISLLGYFAIVFWSLVGSIFFLTHRKELPPANEIVDETAST